MRKFLAMLVLVLGLIGMVGAQQKGMLDSDKSGTPMKTAAGGYDAGMSGGFSENLAYFGKGLLLYVPNRVLDVFDIVSFRLGIGGIVGVGFKVTDFCQLGIQYGDSMFIGNNFNRQYGGGMWAGVSASALCFEQDNYSVFDTFGKQKSYETFSDGMELVDLDSAKYQRGWVDPWAIGCHVAWLIDFDVYFHPLAIPDLVAGIFMFDPDKDDL